MATESSQATQASNPTFPERITAKTTVKKSDMATLKAKSLASVAARRAVGLSPRKSPIERAQEDPTSKAKAVPAMCHHCQGGDADPCVSWRIGNCNITKCPLYAVRPHQRLHGTPTPKALLRQFESCNGEVKR